MKDKRNTIQKQIIIEAVKVLCNHPTSEEVYDYVVKKYPTISKATVYRNLKEMSETGQLKKVEIPSGADRYDHSLHSHSHVKCIVCGKCEDIDIDISESIKTQAENCTTFSIVDYDITLKGICLNCKK